MLVVVLSLEFLIKIWLGFLFECSDAQGNRNTCRIYMNNIIKPLSEPGDNDIPQDRKDDVEKLARYDYGIPSSFTNL